MWPLSIFNYYQSNKKRVLSVFIPVALSVFLIYTILMIIQSSFKIGNDLAVEPRKYYSTISPKGQLLTPEIISSIENTAGVEKVIPCVFDGTNFHSGIGSNYGASMLSLKKEDMNFLMNKLNLKLIEGRLPSVNQEIVLHKKVAANKGLKVGDYIGRMVSKDETLPGAYKIVGIIDGNSILSFAPIDPYFLFSNTNYEYMYGGLIIPKTNSLDKMNAALDAMTPSNFQIDTLTNELKWEKGYTSKINILITVISSLIILIISSCVGFLCYIHFIQRRSEFGLLWAIGFSRQKVINRAFAEVNGITLAGLIIGIPLSMAAGIVLNSAYFNSIGDPLQIISLKYIIGAACSPLFVTLFSLIPIWRVLKKLDPISIVEGVM